MRYLLTLALLLTACKPAAVTPPLAPALGQWSCRYCSGVPAVAQSFAIPGYPGSVNYVTTPASATTAGTLTVTLTVASKGAVYGLSDSTTYGYPQAHLFLERADDAALTNPGYRWWCGSAAYVLESDGSASVALSCPLTPDKWTGVYGQTDAAAFQDTLNNLQYVGVTFGGQSGYGHGVYVQAGTAQVTMGQAVLK